MQLSEPGPTPSARGKFARLLLNATACYLLAWLVVNFIGQATQVSEARRALVPGVWDLGGVRFLLADSGWRRDTVLAVYGLGPTLVLGVGLMAFGWFWWGWRQRRGLVKLLLLWLVFHAANAVLGGLLADTVTRSGSWFVPNWLLAAGGTWPSMALGLLFGLGQVALGFLAAVPFLLAQDSHTILQFERRPQLVVYTIAGPWLVGSLLLAFSKLPHLGLNEALHYATMLLLLVPLAIGCQQEFFNEKEALPYPTHVAWGLVGLAGLGLLAWRLALGSGVHFR
ncbi:hypothetical protein [Hymenobacter psoromatis]|uniref:hypothetical protein n=1 Tax=Hymenobacter psoromatis TaxID=1484116 RepID=UPI001CC147AC|nr:hypothetical protein [Hymenobacter psoromatis]